MALLSGNREIWLRRVGIFSNSKWGLALLALIALVGLGLVAAISFGIAYSIR